MILVEVLSAAAN